MRDVVIVGSGAGGGPLALDLSLAGFDTLVLEKGPRYERRDYVHDELKVSRHDSLFAPSMEDEPHTLVDLKTPNLEPRKTNLGWIACCVGGGTACMGASLYRFHPDDFRMRSRYGGFHEIEDWSYGYVELEPYYSRAEWEIGVSGSSRGDPLSAHRSRPYPMPPLGSHPLADRLAEACRSLGATPFSTPRAINSIPFGGRPPCAECDFCAGFGCPVGARGSIQETLLRRAEATGNCEVRPNAMVREIFLDSRGRAAGCIYLGTDGAEHRVRGRVICVCCSAVETARLLLMSKTSTFPDGLANRSGLVGRHLQFHSTSTGRGRFRHGQHPELALDAPGYFLGVSVADHYFLPTGVSGYRKGGLLRFDLDRVHPISTAQAIARSGSSGLLWGEPLKSALVRYWRDYRDVEFEVFHDFIPTKETRVELDPEVTDKWGLPAARIYLNEPDHHLAAGRWLLARGLEILDELGADELVEGVVGRPTNVMAHGTCRAGRDPDASVLNGFCQSHDVPNLFVVDGSFMPTSGGAPSTLTIIANSFRTAEYMIDRARAPGLV